MNFQFSQSATAKPLKSVFLVNLKPVEGYWFKLNPVSFYHTGDHKAVTFSALAPTSICATAQT